MRSGRAERDQALLSPNQARPMARPRVPLTTFTLMESGRSDDLCIVGPDNGVGLDTLNVYLIKSNTYLSFLLSSLCSMLLR